MRSCLLCSLCGVFIVLALAEKNETSESCKTSITTVSGTHTPAKICSGDLIFEDNFDYLDAQKWQHENTLGGGGNWEFQWYTNNRTSSYVEDGNLVIKPVLTSDAFGEAFLTSGTLDINGGAPANACTNPAFYGCTRSGNAAQIINPVKSARLRTVHSFNFRYGRVEIRAKMPTGDWLWPAIWMMPSYAAFGGWPSSGEIDIVESRGNTNLTKNGVNIGTEQIASTLHYGTDYKHDRWDTAHAEKNTPDGYNTDFHIYELIWNEDNITTSVDGEEIGSIAPPSGGFWELGEFAKINLANPWKGQTIMAPFNQEFYIIINLAVGGIGYFPDDAENADKKPWSNTSPTAAKDFWNDRNNWLSTWNLDEGDEAALKVDYVRVYAL